MKWYHLNLEPKNNILKNAIFQYDVNYSDIQEARGSISISTSVTYRKDNGTGNKNATLFDNNLTPIVGHIANDDNLFWNTYKIMIPIKAIKKDDVNVLNYSFIRDKPSNINDTFYVSDNNYGTLNFYFNSNPLYQFTITPSIFSNNIFSLEINNPIVLKTNIDDFQKPLFTCKLLGKPQINESFEITGNNIYNGNIVPIIINNRVNNLVYFKKPI